MELLLERYKIPINIIITAIFIGIFAFIDYYLFAPYWLLILFGVPFLFFSGLIRAMDFFHTKNDSSEASGNAVAAIFMLVISRALFRASLTLIVPYYIIKVIWMAAV